MNNNNAIDVYQIVTDKIISLLEQGTIPWQQPWTESGPPMNLVSKRPYRGLNVWLLATLNYTRNCFLTWDQLKKLGGSVKQGEHGHVVIFWKMVKKVGETEEGAVKKSATLLRYYKVFNIEQCTGIPEGLLPGKPEREHNPIMECDSIIHTMPLCPVIKHKENDAWYDLKEDYINMPKRKSFKSAESYYATLFHELVHSTGHEKRLNRKTITDMAEFGSEPYSIEELIAELGSCYLSSYAGILNQEIKDRAAYIGGWLGKLQNDKRVIVLAASAAQRAADFILNVQPNETKDEEDQPELLTENE